MYFFMIKRYTGSIYIDNSTPQSSCTIDVGLLAYAYNI